MESDKGRQRPLWLVVLLSIGTFGVFYPAFWLGATWAEMKRELQDDNMHPVWHVLSLAVPIYSLVQIHAHYERINDLLVRVDVTKYVFAGWVVVGAIASGVLSGVGRSLERADVHPASYVFSLLFVGLVAVMTVHGQAGLNNYYRALPGSPVPARVHWAEWLTLGVGLPLFVAVALLNLAVWQGGLVE